MTIRAILFAVVLALAPVGDAAAIHWNLSYRLCPDELIIIPPLILDRPIPVGCEVIDCCPGCPGPGPEFVEWRIEVDPKLYSSAEVRFEQLGARELAALEIEGNTRITKEGLIVGPGRTRIAGVPTSVDGNVPLAFVEPRPRDVRDAADLASDPADAGGGTASSFARAIAIDQYLGRIRVNRFRVHYGLRLCRRPPILTDRLRLENNISSDTAISMVDFNAGSGVPGCRNDQMVRTVTEANMGSALSNGGCNSEVAVFSDDNAMAFDTPVTTWTDPLGDLHTVDLAPILRVPLQIWVARAGADDDATDDAANANLLYNDNNVGVQFDATVTDVSGNAAAVAAIGTSCPTAATIGALQTSGFYTAGRLNVYYVDRAFTGVNCNSDQNVSYVGSTANLATLAHEIGHAYGLRTQADNWSHSNNRAGFGNDNVMWGGGPGTRDHFSVGQAFRINVHDTSQLNVNGDRTGTTRSCQSNVSNAVCPAYEIDSLPH